MLDDRSIMLAQRLRARSQLGTTALSTNKDVMTAVNVETKPLLKQAKLLQHGTHMPRVAVHDHLHRAIVGRVGPAKSIEV